GGGGGGEGGGGAGVRAKGRTTATRRALVPAKSRAHRLAHNKRASARRTGDPGADSQGADRKEGRANNVSHRAARPLPRLHAYGEPCRGVQKDSKRDGASPAETHRRGLA